MKAKYLVLTIALAAFCAMPGWAKHTTGGSGTGGGSCKATNVPLEFIVAPHTATYGGGITGDGVVTDSAGDTIYQDGVGGVWAKFQVCRGTYDFVLNLANTNGRYLNVDFSNAIPGSTITVPVPKTIHQTGLQINDMDNLTYTNGTAITCSGMLLDTSSWSSTPTLTSANAWFKPDSVINTVPGCSSGTGATLANTPNETSAVQVTQLDACTYTVSPVLTSDGNGNNYPIIGVAEVEQLSKHKTQWVAGGQYVMPFNYEVKVLNCTP